MQKSACSRILTFVVGALLLACVSASAKVRLPVLFSDSMVLQADHPVKIWGWADDGELVVVQYKKQVKSVRAAGGRWSVTLSAMPANSQGSVLVVLAENEIELKNVVVGEVWVASGQSNMQWSLRRTDDWTKAAATSSNPHLRLFYVPRVSSGEKLDDIKGDYMGGKPRWQVSGPDSTPEFSAVGYYFGRDLQKARNVPVGIIHTSWGGAPAELWTSPEAMSANAALKKELVDPYEGKVANYEKALAKCDADAKAAKAAGKKFTKRRPRAPRQSSSLYNSMIHPLLNFSIRGAIWYQGEANVGRAHQYRTLFPTMIQSWRKAWKQGDFPFYAVELAPWDFNRKRSLDVIARKPVDSTWGELRDAQIHASKVLRNVGTVTISDVGMKDDIHPTNKAPVGGRLALLARERTYGEGIEASGPSFRGATTSGGEVIIRFSNVGDGLVVKGDGLTGFSIAGPDGQFVWANAEIKGNTVVVSHPNIKKPAGVRFGWADYPVVNLWNKNGLPAHPFRTDRFPLTTEPKKQRR